MRLEKTIAKNIRFRREKKRLTPSALANLSQSDVALISAAESGRIQLSSSSLERIAKALGIPLYILLADDEATIII